MWVTSTEQFAKTPAQKWIELEPDIKSVVMFTQPEASTWLEQVTHQKEGLEAVGVEVLDMIPVTEAVDFGPLAVRALKHNPDGFVTYVYAEAMVKITFELMKRGVTETRRFLYPHSAGSPEFWELADGKLDGAYIWSLFNPKSTNPKWVKLAKAYEREEEARRVCLGEPNPTRRASSSFDEMETCMKCGTENSSVMPTVCTGCDALSLNNPRMLPSAKEKVEKRIQDGVIHRTKMAKRIAEKLKLPPIVINSPELKPDDDLTKAPKRLKMEQELALKSQQEHFYHFNLRERCVETLIDSLDEAKECMEILIHFHKILFKCDKIHTHCIGVITKQFIQYIYDLSKDPSYDDKTEDLDDLVNFEIMETLGIYYHGGREHLVKDHFTLFMEKLPAHLRLEVLTRLYDAMAKEFKQHYKERMKLPKNHNANNVLHNTMKALKARRLRYVELLLWVGSSGDFKEEKDMVDEILMGKNGKGVFFSVDHQAVVKEIDDSRSAQRMITIDVGHLTSSNAGWYYHEAYSRNLFCLTAVVEKFIKESSFIE